MDHAYIYTNSSINTNLIGKECIDNTIMQIEACKDVKISISFQPDGEGVVIEILKPDGDPKKQNIVLSKGDSLNITHAFNVELTRTVWDDHPFPIALEFKGEKYLLNKTKNDKLLLTK